MLNFENIAKFLVDDESKVVDLYAGNPEHEKEFEKQEDKKKRSKYSVFNIINTKRSSGKSG